MLFVSTVLARDFMCFPTEEAQTLYRDIEEKSILQKELDTCQQEIVNLEKQQELSKKEQELTQRLIELAEKERDLYKDAFEREKQITEQALKLVEKTEKRSVWVTIGTILLGISAVVLAFVH